MAHTKASGVTKGNRDSVAKHLGVKVFGGQKILTGGIVVRQRGTFFRNGVGTKRGKDDTIYSVLNGVVNFIKRKGNRYVTVS